MTQMTKTDTSTKSKSSPVDSPSLPTEVGQRSGEHEKKTHTLLFVDDEKSVLKALKRSFIDDEYKILTAENAQEAFDLLARNRVSLIISDHQMPGVTGTEFLSKVRDRDPATIRILLTGAADAKTVMAAIDNGVLYKYVTKPWDDDELRLAVKLALVQYDLLRENTKLRLKSGQQEQEIDKLRRFVSTSCSPLGSVLIDKGLILPAQYDMVKKYCTQNNIVLFRALIELGMLSDQDLLKVIQNESGADTISIDPSALSKDMTQVVSQEISESGCLVPLRSEGNTLVLAMADVLDLSRVDYLSFVTGFNVSALLAPWPDIERAISALYGPEEVDTEPVKEEPETIDHDEIDIVLDLEESATDEQLIARSKLPSAVKLVNAIISKAIRSGASDLHIEPRGNQTIIRYRIDGLLSEGMTIPGRLHLPVISRLKILAKMDISVRRIPQDGRVSVQTRDRQLDLRVSTMPTIHGEKAVCRLLDKSAAVKKISEIGIRGKSLKRLEQIISVPQGIIISTGPTGSGKTTTLYSLLNERMSKELNFVTIEDPVEYLLGDASQVHVHEKIGLTFASTLRSTLRQDPDVILVGEIRDLETAQAAFQAAMTGHLVFTSLHTNSSIGAVTRLIHLGIRPYLVASAIQGIIAQRLVRRICPNCRCQKPYDPALLDNLGLNMTDFPDKLYYGAGCDACGQSGYSGRLGLFEVFHMNEEFRHELTSQYDETRLTNMAISLGMTTLLDDARQKVLDGSTSLEEVLRVLGPAVKYDYACLKCKSDLELRYFTCPYCGEVQRRACENCHARLEPDWVACPYCGRRPETDPLQSGTA